jgi:polysaccharide biosynthesis protein VpsM
LGKPIKKDIKMLTRFLSFPGKAGFLSLIAGFCLLVSAQNSYPQDAAAEKAVEEEKGIKLGPVIVHPSLAVKEQYDDNVFWTPSNKKHDFITTVTPGMGLELPFSDNKLKFDYKADIARFADNDSQNAVNHYVNGLLELNFRDVVFNCGDRFEKRFDRPTSEFTNRVKYDRNTAKATAGMTFNRLEFELGYSDLWYDYETPGYSDKDRYEDVVDLIASYRFLPKTSFLLEFDYGHVNYRTDVKSNSDSYQPLVGLRGKLTAKSTAEIKVGYQARNYKRDGEPDFNSVVTMAGIIEEFTPSNTLTLNFLRKPYESQYSANNYYTLTSPSAMYVHKFTNKFSTKLSGSYQLNAYPRETTENAVTKNRKDNFWSVGTGITYDIKKWLSCGLDYEYKRRDSNFDNFDYKDNLVTLSAAAAF